MARPARVLATISPGLGAGINCHRLQHKLHASVYFPFVHRFRWQASLERDGANKERCGRRLVPEEQFTTVSVVGRYSLGLLKLEKVEFPNPCHRRTRNFAPEVAMKLYPISLIT
jgi:hypothetical protein